MRKLNEEEKEKEEEEEKEEEAFQGGSDKRRRKWRRRETAKMEDRKRGGSKRENGEIVSNSCEDEKLERMMSISESGDEGGRSSTDRRRGKGSEEREKEGEILENAGAESENLFSLLLQWFCCWLAGYLGIAFPWILLALLLRDRLASFTSKRSFGNPRQ